MATEHRLPPELRPTLRHLMIGIVYFSIVFAVAAPFLRSSPSWSVLVAVSLILPASPVVLAVLILVLDRPGPARRWLPHMLAVLFGPVLVLWFDLYEVAARARGTRNLDLIYLAVFNGLGVLEAIRFWRNLPRACPACGFRGLVRTDARLAGPRSCASCGHVEG
jgi:hypothetical protein